MSTPREYGAVSFGGKKHVRDTREIEIEKKRLIIRRENEPENDSDIKTVRYTRALTDVDVRGMHKQTSYVCVCVNACVYAPSYVCEDA